MIMAPAYGSAKKNATDIRLAIDALELVFVRPEIGTFILLSGDSDFSSLVIKLKEYGKYVIGVGIRESSSDLLVMNCDEYYSYNALAGLVKSGEEEVVKHDPWELVTEAVQRMKRNGDVMRADRLKQVMQQIDSSFDEKNLGMSKFSLFVAEAAKKGLLSLTKLENGQYEVDLPHAGAGCPPARTPPPPVEPSENGEVRRSRRGGRGRDRVPRGAARSAVTVERPGQRPLRRPQAHLRRSLLLFHPLRPRLDTIGAGGPAPSRTSESAARPRSSRDRCDRIAAHARRGVQSRSPRSRITGEWRRRRSRQPRPLHCTRATRPRQRKPERAQLHAHSPGCARRRRCRPETSRQRLRGGGLGWRSASCSAARGGRDREHRQLRRRWLAAPRGMGQRGGRGPMGRQGTPPAHILNIGVVGQRSNAIPAVASVAATPIASTESDAPISTGDVAEKKPARGRKRASAKKATRPRPQNRCRRRLPSLANVRRAVDARKRRPRSKAAVLSFVPIDFIARFRAFFNRDTEIVARELLGSILECDTDDGRTSGIIVETEAYIGEHDAACHAAVGRTARTEPLYGPPGNAYVYFIYGMHWCINAVTRAKGLPSAVLIRALEPLEGIDLMRRRRPRARTDRELTNGPGKLCAALGIDKRMNGLPLQRRPVVIRAGQSIPDGDVVITPRIGITQAADWPLRYFVRDNRFVSRAP